MTSEVVWSTGSDVLDAMMGGGFPRQRVVAITGGAGSGKTVLAAQVVAAQAARGVSSVFVAFEQSSERVRADLSGFAWARHLGDARVEIIEAGVPRHAVIDGDFDLEALTTILDATVQRLGAEIVVLDGVDALLSMLGGEDAERRELFRIGTWLRDNGLTGIVTAKSSATWARSLERAAIIDYQSDGVIALDAMQSGTVVSRTLRVSKLRGTEHRGDVTPFVIDAEGLRVAYLPTVQRTAVARSDHRLTSGVKTLDEMLQGGYLRGSATLISGPPGTAKSSLAAAFVHASVGHENAVYVTFDESETELLFHMASIGYDLSEAMASGVLRLLALRSGTAGPERHMIEILAAVDELEASVVVIDPISAFNSGDHPFADLMTHHLFHELDRRGVTTVCTSLVSGTVSDEATKSQISTIADNWLHVTYLAHGGERNRALTVVKARGTANSNQVRELVISSEGVALLPVFLSGGDVLVGAARAQHEERERREEWERAVAFEQRRAAAQNDVDDLVADLGRLERELTARRDALADLDSLRQQELARDVSERAERKRTRNANMTGVS